MFKFLKGVVGSGGGIKDLPYNIGEPYSTAWGGWTHCRGTSKVFVIFGFHIITISARICAFSILCAPIAVVLRILCHFG